MPQKFSKEEIEIIEKSIAYTFDKVNPSPLSCPLLSCVLEVVITLHKGPKVSVVAGDLYLDKHPIFVSNNDFRALTNTNETSTQFFGGHVWVEVKGHVIDLSLLRTAFNEKFPNLRLKDQLSKKFKRSTSGAITLPYGDLLKQFGLQYIRQMLLTKDQVDLIAAGLHAHNKTFPM